MRRFVTIILALLVLISSINLKTVDTYAMNGQPYMERYYTSGSLHFCDAGESFTITYKCYNFSGKMKVKLVATKEYSGTKETFLFKEDDFGENYNNTYELRLNTTGMNPGTYKIVPEVYYYDNNTKKWCLSSGKGDDNTFTLYINGDDLDDPNRPIYNKNYKNEWVGGKWYDKNGKQEKSSKYTWHHDSTGWWFTGSNDKYFTNCWIKIEHKWYYFKDDGYMCQNEWYGGYWFGNSGAWTYSATLDWHRDSNGWWIQDSSGWYPRNQWQKVDGVWRYFNGSGYMVTNQYVDGFWLGLDGRYY